MYSYQHRYHVGNFADLHKHIVLLALLEALQKKDKPFCVLDAFAGEGVYDLNSKESQKNREYMAGFAKIRKVKKPDAPNLIQELLTIAKAYQIGEQTVMYPGSPAIIYAKLRAHDQAIFVENHPQAYRQLKRNFGFQSQLHIHKRDGIEAIKALVPFKERRGLVFVDPSYEVKEEYKTICEMIQRAHLKFSQGIYMVWYPLLREGRHIELRKGLQQNFQNIWHHEWIPVKGNTEGLYGSGVIIINPPWGLDQAVQKSLDFLERL